MAKSKEEQKKLHDELQKRVAVRENLKDVDKIKRELQRAGDIDGLSGGGDFEIESLATIGKSDNELVSALQENLNEFLEKIGEYAFDNSQMVRYFPGNKLVALIKAMKSAGLELESRYVMDIFKTRVKDRNGGKVPTIKERKSLLGGTTERMMKPEEIILKYDVEVDIPKTGDELVSLTAVGTQKGIMKHLNDSLLQNEEVLDPFKKGPRKVVAKFLQAVKLLNPATDNPNEKMFVASLLTPESIQPKSSGDKAQIEKLSAIFKKGTKFLSAKMDKSEKAKTATAK
jgi:hypothetical protein